MRGPAGYERLVALARRHARRSDDAEDIAQEVVLAAIGAGRLDFSSPADRRWMEGAVRRRAAFDARSAARRRARETRWQAERGGDDGSIASETAPGILAGLPPGLRAVAALALSGHDRAEIAYLLGLSDAALRQRIRALKLTLGKKGVSMPHEMIGLDLDLAYGRLRRVLGPALHRHRAMFATHDPDGHVFIFSRSQKG